MLTFIGITLVVIGIATFILKKVFTNNTTFNIPNPKRSFQIIILGVLITILNGMFFYADAGTAYAVQFVSGGDKMIRRVVHNGKKLVGGYNPHLDNTSLERTIYRLYSILLSNH